MILFNRYIAFFLLLCSCFFIVPKELVHEFSCHNDSVDKGHFNTTGTSVETIHHHCDILQLFISPFTKADATNELCGIRLTEKILTFVLIIFSYDVFHSFEIRGPPALA